MAFPRIFQRLFANSGAGPKLRYDIIPWDEESRITSLEAWRQAMIGTPMPMASTTLPPGFMWADGSFASFATYPELKAKYDAGGFAGMLLPYTAQEGDISAFPGKFKPDAANPTGLFLPRLTGLFARYCAGTGAGRFNAAGLPAIRGEVKSFLASNTSFSGALYTDAGYTLSLLGTAGTASFMPILFDAAGSCKLYGTSATVMPASVETPIALYLGRPAEV